MTTQQPTTESPVKATASDAQPASDARSRPRWACVVRHLGEDLAWAINGWTDFPRTTRRVFTGLIGAVAGWTVGLNDVGAQLIDVIGK